MTKQKNKKESEFSHYAASMFERTLPKLILHEIQTKHKPSTRDVSQKPIGAKWIT